MSSDRRGRVHRVLRSATAAAHRKLDHHPLMQRLIGSDLTRETYAESLAAMYRPHVQLERLVHESRHHPEAGLKLSARRELLEADLFELGWPVPPVAHLPPDPCEERAAWWGRAYVLEGSRLGGAVIARCIQSSLGDTVPCRFFEQSSVQDDGNALLAMLERELEKPGDLDQAVAAARATFAAYQDALGACHGVEHQVRVCRGSR